MDLTRRSFVKKSAAGIGLFTIVPSHVLGTNGQTPPSGKLNVAGIGIGGMGRNNVETVGKTENIVALCDVDWGRRAGRVFHAHPDAKKYKDYRIMLEEMGDKIDAVIIATPDHTHAMISMEAMKRGKHVYTQKPLTHTVYEARTLAKAARKYKVATQMGNQGQAGDGPRRLREMIWDGVIGGVREVHVWTDRPNRGLLGQYWPQGVDRPKDRPPVPEHLDWNLFVGPAPMRPYHASYHPFKWRGWWDFGTGALGDIGCHAMDPIFRALKLQHPTSVEGVSTRVNRETYPLGSRVRYEFPARGDMPAVSLTWYDGGLRPLRVPELEKGRGMGAGGTLYVGDKGKILNGRILPASLREAYTRPDPSIPSSPGHEQEWLRACKGGDPGGSNFDWAGPLTEVVLLGNITLRAELREKLDRQILDWDPEKFEFTNLPEANQFLHTEYREGCTLT